MNSMAEIQNVLKHVGTVKKVSHFDFNAA